MYCVLILVLFVVQNQRQAVITLLYRLHNLKVVAARVGKQVYLVCVFCVTTLFKGKCESCTGQKVPRGYPEVYLYVLCVC